MRQQSGNGWHPPREEAAVALPTPFGEFEARAFQCASGFVYLALVRGDITDGSPVLARLHSECLTGDALGSLRCDCGVQLRAALRVVAAEDRGVVLYVTGHEGRGIGLVNKLRAYVEQDRGTDTVDANLHLGFPADSRDYRDAHAVLAALQVRSVRLLTNNPAKARALTAAGVELAGLVPLPTAAHSRNVGYLRTKQRRFGHVSPAGQVLPGPPPEPVNVMTLLGDVTARPDRPYVLVKYAQTVDGRIATTSGDSKWISGEEERRVSHALRAATDAVLVGIGTVMADNPQLTVRMVPGASPIRIVADTWLRTPDTAQVVSDDAATIIFAAAAADPQRREALAAANVHVHTVARSPQGVDLAMMLRTMRDLGITSLLVEGGSRVITSLLAARLVDRLVTAIAPRVLGAGVEAVGPLGVKRVSDGIALRNRCVYLAGDHVLLGWDVVGTARGDEQTTVMSSARA
ncbi:MAG: GTP cyclohydrolase II [Frankiaceae bacterium]